MNISFILPTKTPTKHDIDPMRKILSEINNNDLKIYINKLNKDITHYFTWNVGKELYYKAKKNYPNAKFINLIWDIPEWRIQGKDDYGNLYDWTDYYMPFLNGADFLLSASKNTQKVIKDNYNINSNLFYMFFDDESLNIKSIYDYLPKFKKKNKYFQIIGISRLVPSKKFDVLIKAVSELDEEIKKKVMLTLIGSGPEKNNLEKIAKLNNIKYKNYTNISKSRLVNILKESNLLVAPSVLEGDCGWAPCEAVFCDVPVIVADIEVTREFLKDGAVYFKKNNSRDLSEQIKKFINNEIDKESIIKDAQKNLQFYRMKIFKERLLNFLNEIKYS